MEAASSLALYLELAINAASQLVKYGDNSFWDFEIIIIVPLSMSAAHF